MIDLLKILAKWEIRAILLFALLLGGLALVYLSFFSGFPNPGNEWTPPLRTDLHAGLLTIGSLLLTSVLGLEVAAGLARGQVGSAALPDAESSWANDREPIIIKLFRLLRFQKADPKQHPMVLKWFRLPKTQKEIVALLYEAVHRDRIPLDPFFEAYRKKHSERSMVSSDEMFYRIKALHYGGMLRMEAVGPQATDIVKIQSVGEALRAGGVIFT